MHDLRMLIVVGLVVTACIPQQPPANAETPQTEPAPNTEPATLAAPSTEQDPTTATPSATPAATPPRASGPAIASFTLRNRCSKTVKLFYGKDPKFGSGRNSSLGGNSSQSEQMREGDMLWITDDSGKGIANYSASAGVHEVEIAASCTSLMAH